MNYFTLKITMTTVKDCKLIKTPVNFHLTPMTFVNFYRDENLLLLSQQFLFAWQKNYFDMRTNNSVISNRDQWTCFGVFSTDS